MPIQSDLLVKPGKRLLHIEQHTTLIEVIHLARAALLLADSWVVMQRDDGQWVGNYFSALAIPFTSGDQEASELLMPIYSSRAQWQSLEAVERMSMGTTTAEEMAEHSPLRALIVTDGGILLGLLTVDVSRGFSAPFPGNPQGKPSAEVDSQPVQFSAFYPRTARPDVRYSVLAYVHLENARQSIEQDAAHFKDEMGGSVPPLRSAKKTLEIRPGTPINVAFESDQIIFDPPQLTKTWDAPFTRYEFTFKAPAQLDGELIVGRMVVRINEIDIAHLDFSIEVGVSGRAAVLQGGVEPPNTRSPSEFEAASISAGTTNLYQHIFISYSRRDTTVVEKYLQAMVALGNDVFLDTVSIRTGENWRAALARAIETADVMQLFWSKNSAESSNVADEWKYALNVRCPETHCAGFIRPVAWQAPVPSLPEELSHLNYRLVNGW